MWSTGRVRHFSEWLADRAEARRARQVTVFHARERVARGAAWLDAVDPGWYRRCDPEGLQPAALFHRVQAHLVPPAASLRRGRRRADQVAVALGFRCVGRVCEALREQDTEHLLQAWQEACQQRRRAEALEIDRLLASVEVFAHACEATLAARALQPVSGR